MGDPALEVPSFSNPFVLAITIIESLAFAIMCIIDYRVYQANKKKGTLVSRLLLQGFLFFTFTPILQSLDTFFLDRVTLEAWGYKASFGYSLAITFMAFANIFLAKFTKEIYSGETKGRLVLVAILGIPNVIVFFVLKSMGDPVFSTIFLGIHMLICIMIYGQLFVLSNKTAKKMDSPLNKRAFQFIGLLGLFLILLLVFMLLESILFYGQFSIFGVIGWVMAILGVISAWIGFCLPSWFRRRFESKV